MDSKKQKKVTSKQAEATKSYVFNETGNIMLATIDCAPESIEHTARDIFSEVAVFFAAMTKAISTTINPRTKKPYSIYNYTAINQIISGSGLFIPVSGLDINYQSDQFGEKFSEDVIKKVLGLDPGVHHLAFAKAMLTTMGKKAAEFLKNNSTDKVGNIVFVCEYLYGMPVVSAVVVNLDPQANRQAINLAPCTSVVSQHTNWKIHKDTYLFVTPSFIKKYAPGFKSGKSDAKFNLIEHLKEIIQS